MHDLVPFARSKKREKHPWQSVTFSKVKPWCKARKGVPHDQAIANFIKKNQLYPNFLSAIARRSNN